MVEVIAIVAAFAVAAGVSIWWNHKLDLMIYGCNHKAELIDEAYATKTGEIIVSYVCDECGERRESIVWNDPLEPPRLASDL